MYRVAPGATSQTIEVKFRDTDGLAQTSLTPASGGIYVSYTRTRGTPTSISLVALGSVTASWISGGFIETDPSLSRGMYRVDVPDAAFATGVPWIIVSFGSSTSLHDSVLIRLEQAGTNIGAGSIAYTITVNDINTTLPISGAEVWVSTDEDGVNVVAGVVSTDDFGQVTVMLDSGTYYVWIDHVQYTEANPYTITVS